MLKRFIILTVLVGIHDISFASSQKKKPVSTTKAIKHRKATKKQPIGNSNPIVAAMAAASSSSSSEKKSSGFAYNPQKIRNIFDATKLHKMSRSQLEWFQSCPRCFYVNNACGTNKPSGYPFTLNCAVDTLLKRECDDCREKQTPHPICLENNVNLVPFHHIDSDSTKSPKPEIIDRWRNSLGAGLQHQVLGTNLTFFGGVDDVWIDLKTDILYVVDYKATSKKDEVNIDAEWQNGYKRQMEMYQYLLRKQVDSKGKKFTVSNTAYFVYCNGDSSAPSFDNKISFKTSLIPYEGDDSWVEGDVIKADKCLKSAKMPQSSLACNMCAYMAQYQHHIEQDKVKTATASKK